MNWVWRGLAAGVGVIVGLLVLAILASELGGEVVELHTIDDRGQSQATSLWIVEDEGALYLRAGNPGVGWLLRMRENPAVDVQRGGETERYRAVPDESRRDRINRAMAARYGWADVLIGAMRDSDATVPVRLEPIEAELESESESDADLESESESDANAETSAGETR